MKNKPEEKGVEIPTVKVVQAQIQYCPDHYDELMRALLDRNLGQHISSSAEELADKLMEGQMDVMVEASTAITSSALQLFGPEAVMAQNGCPVCALRSIITHVADYLAVRYTKGN